MSKVWDCPILPVHLSVNSVILYWWWEGGRDLPVLAWTRWAGQEAHGAGARPLPAAVQALRLCQEAVQVPCTLKGQCHQIDIFFKVLNILISTFCVNGDGYQGLSKAFQYLIQLITFYLHLWNYLLILKMLTETLLRLSFSVIGRCSLVPRKLKLWFWFFNSSKKQKIVKAISACTESTYLSSVFWKLFISWHNPFNNSVFHRLHCVSSHTRKNLPLSLSNCYSKKTASREATLKLA